ncbi:SDR family NAD(P)-dependent oxidoreductase [[Flexibacter] sp. ATCC 35208]|uniref:SDR family NAD(P)-dependent oxidoreductase n=1 Tax=[Flexibacter] sp. ATCC 35208 TaxID=1936242 RepID=UPI0009D393A0|nr:SDR family NAD(P)-dependent oxidoreductase [[Flexibacter] sp. ATCC 35208]OMP75376.1 oxidoreductase [[Flexibacter] sp. ATCC 35208]
MSQQHPIICPYDKSSTASDVLTGLDLHGKTVVVTGGHSGLGLATSRALSEAGARIIVGAKDVHAARATFNGLPGFNGSSGIEVGQLDLADLNSVRAFANTILFKEKHIDIVINSAGIMACPERRIGNGWESQFAINHLGHFALVNHLWPALIGGARVIAVSSAGHQNSAIRWHDLHFNEGYDKWQAYGQSKTANALFAVHLDELGKDVGISAFSLHPGKIFTPLQRFLTNDEMVNRGWVDQEGKVVDPTFKTPEQGAATQVWAATSPLLEGLGGVYCEDCNIADVSVETTLTGVRPYAIDPEQAKRLWELSAQLTGM